MSASSSAPSDWLATVDLGQPAVVAPAPRRVRQQFGRVLALCVLLVWPAMFLMPALAIWLSWWLGVL